MEKEQIIFEAKRCLQCHVPSCEVGCPAGVSIKKYLKAITEGDFEKAYRIILQKNIFPDLCGLLCNHEKQCEGKCVRNKIDSHVNIGYIEKSVGAKYCGQLSNQIPVENCNINCKIAIVGAGVTGLTCALVLAKAGFQVTIFEKENHIGGTIKDYIPTFRLDFDFTKNVISQLTKLNVSIKYQQELGKNLKWPDLLDYQYRVICTGAMIPTAININNYSNCYQALDILKSYNKGECKITAEEVVVIGAGNVAMDVARALKRLKNDVTIVYRRTLENSPAAKKEINSMINEGVKVRNLRAPLDVITKDNKTIGLKCQKMRLVENLNGGRLNVEPINGETEDISASIIVTALGSKSDYSILENTTNLQNGWLSFQKENQNYFGGDYFTGPNTIVNAMNDGYKFALDIINKEKQIDAINKSGRSIFFGGSFNPPTIAHYEMVEYLNKRFTNRIIVLPNGNYYPSKELVSCDHRFNMLKLLTKYLPNVEVSDYENHHQFEGTIRTLEHFNHPYFVIGGDSLANLPKWIDGEKLIAENDFIVFNRFSDNAVDIIDNNPLLKKFAEHFIILHVPISNVSATEYRTTKDKNLVTEEVRKYIEKYDLY